ncbi:hypothetical protein BABINDRAFT_12860 [Babjeviella inositovora NRRL Y-12698]|uniref:DUF8032 domain-containing protein n=1 Tax=Babjeviella inositovora NRRL Y-12698 TaxID=984486 RepID=A0A1E3QUQ8_9ASCO|nr:uncharacterized protein BABINDRAFT_12860 [Babjeviella inositovora NRRL Y-12698]ODQ80742.1 hypothetical protein BABINDRAFT_12860 [Babjeviella inositovora NRRL Y-12698]
MEPSHRASMLDVEATWKQLSCTELAIPVHVEAAMRRYTTEPGGSVGVVEAGIAVYTAAYDQRLQRSPDRAPPQQQPQQQPQPGQLSHIQGHLNQGHLNQSQISQPPFQEGMPYAPQPPFYPTAGYGYEYQQPPPSGYAYYPQYPGAGSSGYPPNPAGSGYPPGAANGYPVMVQPPFQGVTGWYPGAAPEVPGEYPAATTLPSLNLAFSSKSSYSKPPGKRSSPQSDYKYAIPGPVPATEPRVKIDTSTGQELMTFQYTQKKVVTPFTIKCPVPIPPNAATTDYRHLIQNPQLDTFLMMLQEQERSSNSTFRQDNCIYPGAMVARENYRGNRWFYENECNRIGWELSWLNSEIRKQRGLIQRAVDSWRNSRHDGSFMSRRVKRRTKAALAAQPNRTSES